MTAPARVDAHHHLWDTARRDLPWMDGPWAAPIRGRFAEPHLVALAREHAMTSTIVVQAATDPAETRELLDVCGGSDVVGGVVGWVDLTDPVLAGVLAELRAGPNGDCLVGVRHPVEDESDPEWLLRPEVQRGIAEVGAAGLAYDLLVRPPQMAAAVRTVRAHSGMTFVLDHLGKPDIAGGAGASAGGWSRAMDDLAAAPNVAAKLSGLVTEADWRSWRPEHLAPFAHRALDRFGPDRLMFGSDWPVCTLAASYTTVVRTAETLIAGLSEPERAAVLGGTARSWYGLADGPAVLC